MGRVEGEEMNSHNKRVYVVTTALALAGWAFFGWYGIGAVAFLLAIAQIV